MSDWSVCHTRSGQGSWSYDLTGQAVMGRHSGISEGEGGKS